MKFKIYKYELIPNPQTGIAEVEMPVNSTILSVHEQDGGIFLWVKVMLHGLMTKYRFLVAVTGHQEYELTEDDKFIDTVHVQVKDKQPFLPNLVFHIFELKGN